MPTVKMKEVAGSQDCYLYVDAVRTLFDLSGYGTAPESGGDAPYAAGANGDVAPKGVVAPAADAQDDRAAPGATVHHLRGTGTENP
jgi:hypothetical protein